MRCVYAGMLAKRLTNTQIIQHKHYVHDHDCILCETDAESFQCIKQQRKLQFLGFI